MFDAVSYNKVDNPEIWAAIQISALEFQVGHQV